MNCAEAGLFGDGAVNRVPFVSLDILDHHPLQRAKRTPAGGISIRILDAQMIEKILLETMVGGYRQYFT